MESKLAKLLKRAAPCNGTDVRHLSKRGRSELPQLHHAKRTAGHLLPDAGEDADDDPGSVDVAYDALLGFMAQKQGSAGAAVHQRQLEEQGHSEEVTSFTA